MIQKTTLLSLFAGATLAGALGASAATTISISTYSLAAYDAEVGTLAYNIFGENFETLGPNPGQREIGASLATGVGTVTTEGNKLGTGGSVLGTGTQLALRNVNGPQIPVETGPGNFGRQNTTPDGAWYLDSNDTIGMAWQIFGAANQLFDKIIFTLSDPGDVGAELEVAAGGSQETISLQPNGGVSLVVIKFSELVNLASLKLFNDQADANTLNDGFSVDDFKVGAVPLPAGGLLLLSGLGALTVARRRKQA